MTTIFIVFLIAFAVSLGMCFLLIPLSRRLGFVDRPDNVRKIQAVPVPKVGGMGIYTGLVISVICLIPFKEHTLVSNEFLNISSSFYNLIIAAFTVMMLGVADDIFDLKPRWKLIGQIAVAVFAYWMGFRIENISHPLSGSFHLGAYSLPVTVFWFVACMNAVNLLDGMDGLAAGTCLFVTITLLSMSLLASNVLGMVLMASFAGAISGFLVLNFPPAKIYLGNSGSLLLGFLVAAFSIIGAQMKAQTAVALFIPIIALGLPIIDTMLAILRRWYHRLPVSGADREHIHHVLTSMGYSPRVAVLMLYVVCMLFGAISLMIMIPRNEVVFLVIILMLVLIYGSIRIFTKMTLTQVVNRIVKGYSRSDRRHDLKLTTQRIIISINKAASISEAWQYCCVLFEIAGFQKANLNIRLPLGKEKQNLTWHSVDEKNREFDKDLSARDYSLASLSIKRNDIPVGEIELFCEAGQISELWMPETADMIDQIRQAFQERLKDFTEKQ